MPRKLTPLDKTVIKLVSNKNDDGGLVPVLEVVNEFLLRLRKNDDEATIILVGHLLVENLLDKIIQQKCLSPKKILNDLRYTFSIKLQIVYSMGLLPVDIHSNITRLNRIRNNFAHNLEYDIKPSDMMVNYEKGAKAYHRDVKMLISRKQFCILLCAEALKQFVSHMLKIGVNPGRLEI